MKKNIAALGLFIGFASTTAIAQDFNQENLYVGGGIGLNSLSGFDDETGFQFFGGYHLDMVDLDQVNLAVEVGYFSSGEFEETETDEFGTYRAEGEANGLWTTAVFGYPLTPELDLLGRIGLDFGDDDGLMFGFGAGYDLTPEFQLRGEYVIRDNIDSLQANLVYNF